MKIVQGDLLQLCRDGKFDVMIHGCNCFHTMGSGIAKQVREEFPEAYKVDCEFAQKGDKNKLGEFSFCKIENFYVINAYTQFEPGKNYNYTAIRKCFKNIYKVFGGKGYRFGIPKIGAGIAGGDWEIISKIIDEEMIGTNLTLVEYVKS